MPKWTTKWPTKEGWYWFYGYRYGKISCGHEEHPVLHLMHGRKCRTGITLICDGQFVYRSEVEEPHFLEAILPELPEM